MEDKSFLKT